MKYFNIIALLLLTAFTVQAQKKASIQDRLTTLEQRSSGSQDVADLVFQIQTLQTQMAELQGVIEEQNHLIGELQKRQKILYVDMDSRIARLEESPLANQQRNELSQDSAISDVLTTDESGDLQISNPEIRESVEANIETSVIAAEQIDVTANITNPLANDLYQSAFNHLKSGRFSESARLFEDFIQQYPKHDLTDNSYYWLGESYYVTRNYSMALSAFQSLEQLFPLSNKLADALLKIGYTYHELEDYQQAKTALTKVTDTFPNSSVARLAKNRISLLRREGKIN
ncbi:MAG: tol-pal system protein YbgF [Proteobacteria bacterium]|nr:tol-pal system protein YbgF [Pseudomonadota bacterium]